MLYRLRQSSTDEGGFTLIELLVVILIIGILAAIAIPAFLSQTSKASDSAAKTQAGTLETVMQTFANEHNGSFAGATIGELQAIEPTLKDTTTATATIVGTPTATGFEVQSVAKGTGDTYKLKYENGTVERTCVNANGSTVCKGGTW
ncbi:MAG TPA: prepilin-type N-terminal cleavage/methylation domain-containing protein [Solirubrobacteraceae bacterium]|jgi:type IV pilus assembly protein PilA|nr:prepilin-type N-terminal cleavage/methylation domain-containing protein [Solirubrobacteraceae bacterium]